MNKDSSSSKNSSTTGSSTSNTPQPFQSLLLDLPLDILIHLVQFLPLASLSKLSRTCSDLYTFVEHHGWKAYVVTHFKHPIYAPSLSNVCSKRNISYKKQLQYIFKVNSAWVNLNLASVQLGPSWPNRFMPNLVLSDINSKLYMSVGSCIRTVTFDKHGYPVVVANPHYEDYQQHHRSQNNRRHQSQHWHSQSQPPRFGTVVKGRRRIDDITTLSNVSKKADTLIVGHISGLLQQLKLDNDAPSLHSVEAYYQNPDAPSNSIVQASDTAGDILASVSYKASSGHLSLYRLLDNSSSDVPHHCRPLVSLELPVRPWSCLISNECNFIAMGLANTKTPLSIQQISESTLHEIHLDSLNVESSKSHPDRIKPTSVYALSTPPVNSNFFSKSSLIAGKYDSTVDIYDFRSTLKPVTTLRDKWTDDAIYSVASGGGGPSAQVVAGLSRHGMMQLWDVRYPKRGVCLYSQGQDNSPVYSLAMEHTRLYGITDRRAWMMETVTGDQSLDTPSRGSYKSPLQYWTHAEGNRLRTTLQDCH